MSERMLIGGDWIEGTGPALASINPADGSLNAEFSTATETEVDDAVAAAKESYYSGEWRALKPHQRADYLYAFCQTLLDRKEDIARLQMRENGKTITECRGQVDQAAGIVRYFAAVCETMEAEVTPPRGDYVSMVSYEPYGVVSLITPWNSPITLNAQKLAPALAAGNSVVLKPSEVTPGVGLAMGRICQDIGIPSGVVNVVSGTGADAGDRLVRHPDVRMVSFTGGTQSGRAIAKAAGERLVPAALELGGKSPNLVFADCDLDKAAVGVASGIFGSHGQSCIAGSRLFVEASIRDEFIDKLAALAAAWRIGHPEDENAQMGPMASFQHRDRIAGYVTSAVDEGGEIISGGGAPDGPGFERGAYYLPTIVGGLHHGARACQEEIFGPVLCALPFTDEDDVAAQANDTVYGLACGIWTSDFAKAWRVCQRIEAGSVWINAYKQVSISTPFGGMKESGIGREKGIDGVRLYTEPKAIYLAT